MNDWLQNAFTNDWIRGIRIALLSSGGTLLTMSRFRKSQDKTNKILVDVVKAIAGKSSKPVDSSDAEIWGGFIKPDFKSYNDPWCMELINPNNFLETHRRRYNDQNCAKYNFLFFIKDGYEPFKRFIKFQAMVHLGFKEEEINAEDFNEKLKEKIKAYKIVSNEKRLPKTLDNISVFFNNTFEKPFMTFFRGEKQIGKFALLYFLIKENEECPHFIIQITDAETWLKLDSTWDKASMNAEKIEGVDVFEKYLSL
jgi:hypothetical protein